MIGKAAFRHVVNDPRFRKTPGCIETPKGKDLREDIMNLQTLRSLVARRPSPKKEKTVNKLVSLHSSVSLGNAVEAPPGKLRKLKRAGDVLD